MNKLKDWLYAGGILLAVGFWFFTLYGLPPRVEILEKKVSAHEERVPT